MSADPQVCSTEVTPIRAPRCLGSAAIVITVSAEDLTEGRKSRLVLIGDVANRRRQGKDHVVIWDRPELGLSLGQPAPRRRALALRAMPIAAANLSDDFVGAVLGARDMPAEGRRAAALNRRHHFRLLKAHVTGVGVAPCRSVVAEDIRDFQNSPPHDRQGLRVACRLQTSAGQAIQRAHHVADCWLRRVCKARSYRARVSQQNLDHPDIDVLLK